MITIYQTNNAKCAQNSIMQCLSHTDQRNLDFKHVVIVPDRASYEAEKALIATLGGSFNTEVLTFRRLANRFLPAHKYLSKQSGIIALTKIINENRAKFQYYTKGTSQAGFVSNMYDTISQLKYCNVTPEHLSDIDIKHEKAPSLAGLKTKLCDIKLVYQEYQKFLGKTYVDSSDKLQLLNLHFQAHPDKISNYYFYLYDFDNFSAQEYALIELFAKYGKGVFVACPTSTSPRDAHLYLNDVFGGIVNIANKLGQTPNLISNKFYQNNHTKQIGDNLYRYQDLSAPIENEDFVEIFQGNGRLQEVYALACKIQKYVRSGGRFGDVYVVTSDVNKYKNAVRTVFDEFDIPYFCDVKTPLNFHFYSQFLLDYLNVFKTNFSLKSVLSFVKNPLLGVEENDVFVFENYCYKYNPDHHFEQEFIFGAKEDGFSIAQSVRAKFMDIASNNPIPKTATVNQYVQSLKSLTTNLGLEQGCELFAQKQLQSNFDNHAKTTQQVVEKFDQVLVQMEQMLPEYNTSLDEFLQILTIALKSVNVSVLPQKTDSVMVVNMAKSRKHDIGFLALLGANNGAMPRVQSDCKMLTDKEITAMNTALEELKLPQDKVALSVQPFIETENKRERFMLLQLLQEPKDKLFVSYTTTDEGTALSPSSFIAQLGKLFKVKLKTPKVKDGKKIEYEDLSKTEHADEDVYTFKQAMSKLVLSRQRELSGEPVSLPHYDELYQKYQAQVDQYFAPKDSQITIANGEKLFLKNKKVSISKITQFYSCPYRFYFQYGLAIEKRKEAKLQSDALGTILHAVLEKYVNKMDVNESNEVTAQKAKDYFDKIMQQDEYKAMLADPNSSNMLKMLSKEAVKLCKVVKSHYATSEFVNLGTEIKFGKRSEYSKVKFKNIPKGTFNRAKCKMPNKVDLIRYPSVKIKFDDNEFLINGVIDRVDVNGTNFVVVDYKSGTSAAEFSESEFYVGQKLQLLIYLKAVIDNIKPRIDGKVIKDENGNDAQYKPAGFYYFGVHDKFVKPNETGYVYNGRTIDDVTIASQIDTKLNNGASKRLGVALTSKGALNGNGRIITQSQLQAEIDYAVMMIENAGKQIKQGVIYVSPYKGSCDYCDYKCICDNEDIYKNLERKTVTFYRKGKKDSSTTGEKLTQAYIKRADIEEIVNNVKEKRRNEV